LKRNYVIAFIIAIIALPSGFLATAHAQSQPTVSLSPSTFAATSVGQTFEVNLTISNVQSLWGWSVNITWDPTYLSLNSVSEGDFLTSQVGQTFFLNTPTNSTKGWCNINDASASLSSVASGSGTLAILKFATVQRCSQTTISSNVVLYGVLPASATVGTPQPEISPVSPTSQTTITTHTGAPPTANAGPNQTVPKGYTVIFNASQSVCEGNNPTYTWAFTDVTPQTLTGMITNYTFDNPAIYNVELTVQDSIGVGTSNVTITVTNETLTPLSIIISGVKSGSSISAGEEITFEVENSTLRNVPIENCQWDMGDKSSPQVTSTPVEKYGYSNDGTFNVRVTVHYTDGINQIGSTTVTIGQTSGPAPTPSNANSNTPSAPSSTPQATATPTFQATATNDQSLALPTAVLAILIGTTVFILFGSIFWLRKNSNMRQ